jgi:poly-beta-1,6-N-acetyl-D-glucosamine biosynthesis protein PgaD
MRSGKARTVEAAVIAGSAHRAEPAASAGSASCATASGLSGFLERRYAHRPDRVKSGLLWALTAVFWGLWLYLVLPLLDLVLWALGVRLVLYQMVDLGGYQGLIRSLVGYSVVLLSIVAALLLWILWNVRRYGGEHDRRTVMPADLTDPEIAAVFRLDEGALADLRQMRSVLVDFDADDCLTLSDLRLGGQITQYRGY